MRDESVNDELKLKERNNVQVATEHRRAASLCEVSQIANTIQKLFERDYRCSKLSLMPAVCLENTRMNYNSSGACQTDQRIIEKAQQHLGTLHTQASKLPRREIYM